MIVVRLEGGIGNQMFQYATAKSLASRLRSNLFYDDSLLKLRRRGLTPRKNELGKFNCVIRPAPAYFIFFSIFGKKLSNLLSFFTPFQVLVEKGKFDGRLNHADGSVYLIGYWQNWEYFNSISTQLCKDFTPVESLSPRSSLLMDSIVENTGSVAVHIRRGDYVSNSDAAKFHGALDMSYYEKAINTIVSNIKNPIFFIFSDDIPWCKKFLPLKNNIVFVDHNYQKDAWQDLILMRACTHHVIANSSFSWWGAWLSDKDKRGINNIIIAPKKWFANSLDSHHCGLPPHWLII